MDLDSGLEVVLEVVLAVRLDLETMLEAALEVVLGMPPEEGHGLHQALEHGSAQYPYAGTSLLLVQLTSQFGMKVMVRVDVLITFTAFRRVKRGTCAARGL